MLAQDFVTRSAKILSAFIGDEIPQDVLQQRVRAAFAFPAPVSKVQEDVGCLSCSMALRWRSRISAAALWRRC